jgi:DNA-binding MarR family transcriptional regulator
MNAPHTVKTPADVTHLADGLRPVLLRLGRQLRRQSQVLGLSPLDAMLLGHVRKNEGLGVSELADLEQMSRPSMSVHVKRLEAAGWIARMAETGEDKRRVRLALTPAGAKALDAIRRRRNDWLANKLAGLTPADRATLAAALQPLEQLIAGDRP